MYRATVEILGQSILEFRNYFYYCFASLWVGPGTKSCIWKFSGDDDLPKRDDIGERRRKHELRVLAGAGIKSVDYVDDETGNFSSDENADVSEKNDSGSDLEYYKQVKQQHAAKLAAKSNKYSRYHHWTKYRILLFNQ